MRFAEKYRPATLSDVVGQSHCTRRLQRFASSPFATCWIFQGPPGVGKTATALALASDLGAVDPWSGLEVICTAQLGKAEAEAAVKRLRQRSLAGEWNVLVLEELERLSPQCQVYLKVALASENLPPRAVVIATSNDTSAIDPALLERFGKPLEFNGGAGLQVSGLERVAEIWARESDGAPLPPESKRWGWHCENGRQVRYSLRSALDELQQAILLLPEPMECAA